MKYGQKAVFILIISLLILSFSFPASAEILFGPDYELKLHEYLSEAQSSITIAMYFIILEPQGKGPINELVSALIDAKERGVSVKVILEDSKIKENRLAYQKLKENNITVYFDTPQHLLHIKGVAVDDRYLFIGSANWSKAAFHNNHEATSLEDSREASLSFQHYVDNIPIQEFDTFLPVTEGVAIASDFLLSPKSGRKLLKSQAKGQLDLYLLLNKIRQETGEEKLSINYDDLAMQMKYRPLKQLGKYRNEHHYFYERIHHLLKRLKRYDLITYKKGVVTLNPLHVKLDGVNVLHTQNLKLERSSTSFLIPFEYWVHNYPVHLSLRAKYMYIICLYEASRSTRYPFWFRSQKDMSELYGISDTTISKGLLELEDKGIIKVQRDKPTPPDFADRKANVYQMLPLKEIK